MINETKLLDLKKEQSSVTEGIFNFSQTLKKSQQLPKTAATKLLNSPKFASYVENLSVVNQGKVYKSLAKLSDKGWEVLAPLGYVTSVLSKTSDGAKLIAGSKVGLTIFKKLDSVSLF